MRPAIHAFWCLLFAAAALAAEPKLALQQIVTGLDQPIGLANAGDNRLFIVLQRGQIVIWDGNQVLPTPFLDVRSIVSCCGERGLLDVAFHPHYADNGLFFVYYTDPSGNLNLVRYRVQSGNPNQADLGTATPILKVAHPNFDNHNGGNLAFGPDGYLYIGIGDGGSGGDPNNNAQNLSRLLGKILRLDVDGGLPYAIPPDNPFRNQQNALPEIWDYGLRNPWRFTFDRETGDMLIGDVGQDRYEEVDFEPASSIGGVDYGWRKMEGMHCFNPSNCSVGQSRLPILEYDHGSNNCSITGGYRYRGTRYPNMRGIYFYGDYCTGRIWGASEDGGVWSTKLYLTTGLNISTFGEDQAGELYVANQKGAVYHLVDTSEPQPPPRRRRAATAR